MGAFFSISIVIVLLIISIIYFLKNKIDSYETKLYGIILIVTIIGLFLEVLTWVLFKIKFDINGILYKLLSKITASYYVMFCGLNTNYFSSVSGVSKHKIKIFNIFFVMSIILVIILPIDYNINKDIITPTGLSIFTSYISCGIISLINAIICFFFPKKEKRKKYIPLYCSIGLGGIAIIVSIFFPQLFLIGYVIALIVIIMFFTIENPDVKMLNEVNLAKNQAEQANQAKTDFLSSMSHEIRTPLNAIVGFSSVITNAETLDEAKENAKDIVDASNTLLEIVNGILDISKIEAGKLELVNKDYNSYELFDSAAKLISNKMQEKGLDFQVNIAGDMPKVLYGDAANVKKVVVNLLSNAYKYTEKGSVKYTVSSIINKDFCRLVISVEDTGRGIKKENIDKLFSKFQRLDEDRNTTIEGTGLGLAITKQLVEMMGGKIVCQSVYGSGSKFTVILDQRITSMFENKSQNITVKEAPLNVKGKRILIVDDNTLNLKVAERLIKQFNPKIDTLDSGIACLEKIQTGENYDLILLDDMMPKLSGTETLERLKQINGFNTPVVALTANAIAGMKEQYLAKGFSDYLAKPIEKQELIRVFKTFLMEQNKTMKIDFGALPEEIYQIDEEHAASLIPDNQKVEPFPKETLLKEEDNNTQEYKINEENKFDIKYLKENNVDVDKGIELLGDENMYKETMNDFYDGLKARLANLKDYLVNKDMNTYSINIHALKSDAKYLGLTKLAEIALEEELKSKENDYEFIKNDFNILMEELQRLIPIIKNYLKK